MLSDTQLAQAQQDELEAATDNNGAERVRFLWIGGSCLVAMCVAYLALFQSRTLWDRPISLPGGEDGPFEAVRRFFPTEWLGAHRGSGLGLLNVGLYLVILGSLFAAYWLTLRGASRRSINAPNGGNHLLRLILVLTALALFVLFWLPGTQSADLHSYIWYGRILVTFGDNPFVHVPLEYAGRDAGGWLQQVYWQEVPSVYGPVWVLLAGGLAWLGNLISSTEMWPHLLGHKLIAAGAHLANIALIWGVSGLVAQRWVQGEKGRRFRLLATLAYAWSPLALIEFGGNGHNDVLMLTGILAALWLHLAGRWRLTALALALAALVKVAVLFLLPGYLWLLVRGRDHVGKANPAQEGKLSLRSRLSMLGQAMLIILATWILFYIPFWVGPETLGPLLGGPASNRFTNSLAAMLRFQGGEWLHSLATANGWTELSKQGAVALQHAHEGPLRLLTLGLTIPVAALATWRGRTFPLMLQGWGWTLFVYLTVGAVWFWPWYVTWLLPIAGLVYGGKLSTAIQILCASSLILYALYPLMAAPLERVPYYRSLITMLPPLVYLALTGLRSVVRERKLGPNNKAAQPT
jgi:hypothetical protein